MPRDLFACLPEHPESRRSTRLLPVSLLLHAVLIGGAIIAPLLATGELPKVTGTRTPPLIVKALPVLEVVSPPVRVPRPRSAPSSSSGSTIEPTARPQPAFSFDEEVAEPGAVSMGQSIGVPGTPEGQIGSGTGGSGTGDPGIAQTPSGPVRPGGDIERPQKIRHVPPEYPVIARQIRRQGTVVIDAIIGPDGQVTQARIRQSVPLLDDAALAAVRQWVYTPTRLNGKPVAVIMTVEVNFRLR